MNQKFSPSDYIIPRWVNQGVVTFGKYHYRVGAPKQFFTLRITTMWVNQKVFILRMCHFLVSEKIPSHSELIIVGLVKSYIHILRMYYRRVSEKRHSHTQNALSLGKRKRTPSYSECIYRRVGEKKDILTLRSIIVALVVSSR